MKDSHRDDICGTGIDDLSATLRPRRIRDWSARHRKTARQIKHFGQTIIVVVPDPDSDNPYFFYTIAPKRLARIADDRRPTRACLSIKPGRQIQRDHGRPFGDNEIVSLGGRVPVKFIDVTMRARPTSQSRSKTFTRLTPPRFVSWPRPIASATFPATPLCDEPCASQPLLIA